MTSTLPATRTRSVYVADQLHQIEKSLGLGDWASAVTAVNAALRAAPTDPHALHASGRLCELADQPDDAITQWVHAVAIDPTIAPAWSAIGTLLSRGVPLANPHLMALLAFCQAQRADPTWLMPAWHAALLYHALGHEEAAHASMARCQTIMLSHGDNPKNTGTVNLHNRAYLLLTLGFFAEGFTCYEFRLQDVGHAMGDRARTRPPAGVPRWTHGAPPQRLAVFVEQGAGDMFMTLPYVAQLARNGVQVTLEMFPSMSGLIRHRMVQQEGVTCIGQDAELPFPVDGYVWAMSLPGLMREHDDAERRLPVFRPSAVPNKSMVAFCWQGSRAHKSDRIRSMPVEQLQGLAAWCLEHGYTPVAINPGEPCPDFLQDPGPIASFSESAALLDECAAVVSVDTALVHLAGCLGVPTFAMLAALPDWRWGLHDQGNVRWYDSVTLVRQPTIGDWDRVVADVHKQLAALLTPSDNGVPT